MTILQVTSHLNVGGITRYLLALSKGLRERGHRVIIASDRGQAESQAASLGLTHWRLPLHTSAEFSPRVWWSRGQLQRRLRTEPVDLIHAHTRVGQVVAHAISRELGIPYVTTWHGIFKRRLGRRLWPCTGDRTIAISRLVYEDLRQQFHVPASRIRRVHNGIDLAYYAVPPDPGIVQAYRARWRLAADQPVIGGIGRLAAGRVKGFDLILVTASLLKETMPGLHVLIVGDGPRRPFLEDVANRLGLQECVRFAGTAEDIRVPLALMDVFIFSSRWPEAFGLTLVEAMAAGKPVVATDSGAVPDIVRHDVDGWLVPQNDASAMADAVLRLIQDRATAARLARQAQQRVREAFSVDRMVEQVEAVYRELVQ